MHTAQRGSPHLSCPPACPPLQVQQHGDAPSDLKLDNFCNFLLETPLAAVSRQQDSGAPAGCGYGSFHQQYWLDGVLVAVAVVDVLPRWAVGGAGRAGGQHWEAGVMSVPALDMHMLRCC